LNISSVVKRVTILTTAQLQEKNDNEQSNMVSKSEFKNLFQSSLKEMLTKKDKQTKKKENAEGNDESLDMNVFEKTPMHPNHMFSQEWPTTLYF
jgi:hypothetical protein